MNKIIPSVIIGVLLSCHAGKKQENKIATLTDANFGTAITDSKMPLLVDFYAPWCPPCRKLKPIIKSLAVKYRKKLKFYKINVDNSPKISRKYKIRAIPTLIIFMNGKAVSRKTGFFTKRQLSLWIEKTLIKILRKRIKVEVIEYAKKEGFKLNPHTPTVNAIIEILAENELKYGARYCPCRIRTGNEEEDKKLICPCFWHKKEIKEKGSCLCGLFLAK